MTKILAFNSTVWFETVSQVTIRWKKFYSEYVRKTASLSIPLHVIYYEQLKENTTAQVRQILQFYKNTTGFEPDNVEERIECINQVRNLNPSEILNNGRSEHLRPTESFDRYAILN